MKKKKMLSMLLVFVMALTVPMSVCAEEISAMDSVEEIETAIVSDSEEVIAEEESMITDEEDVTMEAVEAEPEAEISLAEEPQEDVSAEITRESAASAANTVTYRTHVQTYGWQGWKQNGAMSGTSGKAKRLEGIEIKLENAAYAGSIQYRTHVQTYGWQGWKQDGAMSGTSGQAKRLEAIQIQLTGTMASHYDVYYRVHAQTFGWMGWAKNGESAGTAGYSKRLEAIEIRLVTKGGSAPGSTQNAYRHPLIQYKTHVQTYGWQGWKQDGAMSGTSGQAKRLEGINIALCNQDYPGSVRYRTHVQTYGWQNYVADGAMSGTSGKAKRLEAIQIELTGEMANHYDIYYRVHAQTFGWMGWAKNGQQAGTAGYAKRLEGIEIRLVAKNGSAPGTTENPFVEATESCTHNWIDNYKTETIPAYAEKILIKEPWYTVECVKAALDEQVFVSPERTEYAEVSICHVCGYYAWTKEDVLNHEFEEYYNTRVSHGPWLVGTRLVTIPAQYQTIHHNHEFEYDLVLHDTHYKTVWHQPQTKKVKVNTTCTKCGAVK